MPRITEISLVACAALSGVILFGNSSQAADDKNKDTALDGEKIFMTGGDATGCFGCHGKEGRGMPTRGAFPRLAGLSADYIVQQMQAFASGDRKNEIMHPIARTLPDDQIKAVAAWLEKQTPDGDKTPGLPDEKATFAGMMISDQGVSDAGVPACSQCHGPRGSGAGTGPKLAGQARDYIIAQLEGWKEGKRAKGAGAQMVSVVSEMSKEQIRQVAQYFESLDPLEDHKASEISDPAGSGAKKDDKPAGEKPAKEQK